MVGKTEEDVTERLYGGIGQIADSIETALQNQLGEFMGLPPPGQAPDSTGAPSGSAALQARRAAAAERYKR
jgi:hypothetical protein